MCNCLMQESKKHYKMQEIQNIISFHNYSPSFSRLRQLPKIEPGTAFLLPGTGWEGGREGGREMF